MEYYINQIPAYLYLSVQTPLAIFYLIYNQYQSRLQNKFVTYMQVKTPYYTNSLQLENILMVQCISQSRCLQYFIFLGDTYNNVNLIKIACLAPFHSMGTSERFFFFFRLHHSATKALLTFHASLICIINNALCLY